MARTCKHAKTVNGQLAGRGQCLHAQANPTIPSQGVQLSFFTVPPCACHAVFSPFIKDLPHFTWEWCGGPKSGGQGGKPFTISLYSDSMPFGLSSIRQAKSRM